MLINPARADKMGLESSGSCPHLPQMASNTLHQWFLHYSHAVHHGFSKYLPHPRGRVLLQWHCTRELYFLDYLHYLTVASVCLWTGSSTSKKPEVIFQMCSISCPQIQMPHSSAGTFPIAPHPRYHTVQTQNNGGLLSHLPGYFPSREEQVYRFLCAHMSSTCTKPSPSTSFSFLWDRAKCTSIFSIKPAKPGY